MIDYFEHIDDYKNGKLTGSALADFESALLTDQELKSAVEHYELAKEISLGYLEEEVRGVLSEVSKEDNQVQPSQSKPKRFRVWKLAIGVAAMMCLYFYTTMPKGNSEEDIMLEQRIEYAMNEYSVPQVVFQRSSEEDAMLLIDKAKQAFSLKDFDTSKTILKSIDIDNQDDDWNRLMAHISFIQRDYCDALKHIDSISEKSVYSKEIVEVRKLIDGILQGVLPCE